MERQSAALEQLLRRAGAEGPDQRILDCACGIGTQSLGLARRGFKITGCDISTAAIARARNEASQRGLNIDFRVMDMCDLSGLGDNRFDVVICMDNALPHLTTDQALLQAAAQIRNILRSGGVFVASIRDYDLLLAERPVMQGPFFYGNEDTRRVVFQIWDWIDQFHYQFHLCITRRIAGRWETFHTAARYRAFRRSELETVLRQAGFVNTTWLSPAESGFYQPIFTARAT